MRQSPPLRSAPLDNRFFHVTNAEGVEAGQRLVEEQDARSVQQAARNGDLLLHAAGQLAGQRVFLAGELELLEKSAGLTVEVGHPVDPRCQAQMLQDGEVVEQVRFVRHERDPPLRLDGIANDVVPLDRDCAASRRLDADDAAKRGRLAGAVGSDEAEHLSRPDVTGEVVNGLEGAVGLREVDDVDHTMPAIGSADDESDDYVISE